MVFGVLTTDTEQQAVDRIGGCEGHKGEEAAQTALEMVALLRQIPGSSDYKHAAMLRLVLPKGSLERATFQLFEDADLAVQRGSDVDYRGTIDGPRVLDVTVLRPQEIPRYVASGLFDLGVTGRDWVGGDQGRRHDAQRAPTTRRRPLVLSGWCSPFRATPRPRPWSTCRPGCGCRPSTPSYHAILRRGGRRRTEITLSYGATEAKIPEIADAVVEITETGRAFRAAGLKIIDTLLVSYTELIANRESHDDPRKRHAMEQLQTLLTGALEARGRVLVKLNVEHAGLDRVVSLLRAQVAHRLQALRRGGLRGRGGRGEIGDQHVDPHARRRGDRHHRAADLQDRALSCRERCA